jgi:hypothetical protein
MKIKPLELFATPNGWPGLEEWINGHTGSEKAVAATAACMAWNLACAVSAAPEPEPE